MTSWGNTPTNPTRAEQYAYDGEGHVVARHILYDGDLVDSIYLAGLEEITTRSTGTSTMVFLAWGSGGGARWAVRTDGTLTYLIRDHVGSVVVGLDTTGNATASRLYDVRGVPRYFSPDGFTDSLLGEEGYGGQPSDNGVSGLGMMGARQYEGDLSQFTSADTVADGLNRYAYAHDNPETLTDPSGHMVRNCGVNDDFCTGAGGVNSPPPPKTKDCHATNTCGGGSPPGNTPPGKCNGGCKTSTGTNFSDSGTACTEDCFDTLRNLAKFVSSELDTMTRDASKWAAWIGYPGAVLGFVGLVGAVFTEGATLTIGVVGANATELGLMLGVLANELSDLHAWFDDQSQWTDDDFTLDSLEAFRQQLSDEFTQYDAYFVGAGAGTLALLQEAGIGGALGGLYGLNSTLNLDSWLSGVVDSEEHLVQFGVEQDQRGTQ